MNKKYVIKMLTILSTVLVIAIAALAAILAIVSDESIIRAFAIGAGIGALIGGLLKCLVIIPARYKDKDERALLVVLLSSLVSTTVFALTSYIFFMLALTGVMTIEAFDTINILTYAGIIIALTFVSEKIAYVIIDKTL